MTLLNNRLTVLNNRVTLLGGFLAIISAGFVVPNTIATVMSQTNIFVFSPADMGWYLALIVTSTIVATILVWLWVKRRGLLPRTLEENEERFISDVEKEKEIATRQLTDRVSVRQDLRFLFLLGAESRAHLD